MSDKLPISPGHGNPIRWPSESVNLTSRPEPPQDLLYRADTLVPDLAAANYILTLQLSHFTVSDHS